MKKLIIAAALSAGLAFGLAAPAQAAAKPTKFKNCTAVNAKYRHGIAQTKKSKDKVRSGKPATGFLVNGDLYAANKGLDHDGIVCEKR